MGEVVPLKREPPSSPGNGAREAALDYWRRYAAENGNCHCDDC